MAPRLLEPPTNGTDRAARSDPRQPLFPSSILSILEAPETVEVMSLVPWYPDDMDDEPPEGPELLYGHRICGVAQVPTVERRRALARALVTANREGLGWALCFDPHYAVRASRDGQTADFLICFWCGNVLVVGPGEHARTYPFGWSAARLLRRERRRGGVGWLWFWRRWLP